MTTLLADWQQAKKTFEANAKKKPPKPEVLGLFRKVTGISPALKKLDSASNSTQASKAKEEFDKARTKYLKFLKEHKKGFEPTVVTPITKALDQLLVDIENITNAAAGTVNSHLVKKSLKLRSDDLVKALKDNGLSSKAFKLPDTDLIEFKADIELDEQADNATLVARMHEAIQKLMKAESTALVAGMTKIEAALKKDPTKKAELEKLLQQTYAKTKTTIKTKGVTAVADVLKKAKSDKKEYKEYKIKAAISVTSKSVSIVAGTAAIAGAGWTGFGTVAGLAAVVKNVVGLVAEVSRLRDEAKTFGKKIGDDIAKLKKQSAEVAGGREVASAVLEKLTGVRATSVAKIEADIGQFESKLTGCRDKARAAGGKINAMIDANTEFAKTIVSCKALAKEARILADPVRQMEATHKKQVKAVELLLNNILKQTEMDKDGQESLKKFKEFLTDAKEEVPAWADKMAKYAVPFLDLAYVNWSDVPGQAVKITTTVGSIMVDLEQKALDVKKETDNLVKVHGIAQTTGLTIAKHLVK